jgi:hypothetical protein
MTAVTPAGQQQESEALARRRAAVAALRVAARLCADTALALGDHVPPLQARAAARWAAADLALLSEQLRKLAGPQPGRRRG